MQCGVTADRQCLPSTPPSLARPGPAPAHQEPRCPLGKDELWCCPLCTSAPRVSLATLSSLSFHQKLPSSSHPISPVSCSYEHSFICRAFRGVTSKLLFFFPFYLKGGSSRRNQDGVVKAPEAEIADLAPHLMATIAHSGQLSLLAELTDSSLSFPSRDPGLGNHCPKSAISLLLPPDNGLCVGVSHVRLVVPAKFLCD